MTCLINNSLGSFFVALICLTCVQLSAANDDPGLAKNASQPSAHSEKTVIYVAKDVITVDPKQPRADAVAVSSGRILGVGTKPELVELLGAEKVVIDDRFADKVMVPGLIEQHIHPILSALTLMSSVISIEEWQLPNGTFPAARNRKDYFKRLREVEAAMEDPSAPLISWGFHHYFHNKLTRADLDTVSTERAILIWHRSAHEFILNTPALKAAGISGETLQQTSEVNREQINFEEGHFWERGTFDFLMPRILPLIGSPAKMTAGIELMANYLHAAGVTTSAEPGGVSGYYQPQITVLGNTNTPFRFYFIPDGRSLTLEYTGADLLDATEQVLTGARGHTAFLPKQVKLFADGAIFSQLMQMEDGYLDGHHGEWLMQEDVFAAAFRTYWEDGYQIHVHQNGDAGLERVLDVLEDNQRRHPRKNHRTTLVHFGFSTTEQVKRIARLGAIVSANPYYTVALADQYSAFGVGPQRAESMVRLGDVARAGISFSLHSDMPMAPARPLFLMWAAVNRSTFSGRVAGPEQRISVEDALKAVTLDAAYSLQLEDEIGSISPGKRANFTILEENPFTVNAAEIKNIGIWGTVLEGRLQPLPR